MILIKRKVKIKVVVTTNIEIIKAFQREKGTAFLVETYKGITEYTGQRIYNFCCNFLFQ